MSRLIGGYLPGLGLSAGQTAHIRSKVHESVVERKLVYLRALRHPVTIRHLHLDHICSGHGHDIVISVDRVYEQAGEYGHSVRREYAFLIAHSMLHLLGYDHMEPGDAAVMERKQEEILDRLGITRSEQQGAVK